MPLLMNILLFETVKYIAPGISRDLQEFAANTLDLEGVAAVVTSANPLCSLSDLARHLYVLLHVRELHATLTCAKLIVMRFRYWWQPPVRQCMAVALKCDSQRWTRATLPFAAPPTQVDSE